MLALAFTAALVALADASSQSSAFSSVLQQGASGGISAVNSASHADKPWSPSHIGHSDSNDFRQEHDLLDSSEQAGNLDGDPEIKGLSARPPADPLAAHFRSRLRSFFQKARHGHADAGTTEVLNLPAAAAAGVHHFDLGLSRRNSLGGGSTRASGLSHLPLAEEVEDDEALFAAMLAHEARAHALKPTEARAYVACGAQAHASSARLALSNVDQTPRKVPRPLGGQKKTHAHDNSKHEHAPQSADTYQPRMAYTSRSEGVACWLAQLNVTGVAELRSLPHVFTHVSPVPAAAKLSPGLLFSEPSSTPTQVNGDPSMAGGVEMNVSPQQPRLRLSEHVFGTPPQLPPRREGQTTSHLSPSLRGSAGESSSAPADWSHRGAAAAGATGIAEWQGFEGRGLRVHFSPDVATSSHAAREKLAASWVDAEFGLVRGRSSSSISGSRHESQGSGITDSARKASDNEEVQPQHEFFPLLSDENRDDVDGVALSIGAKSGRSRLPAAAAAAAAGLWGAARTAAQEGLCSSVLATHLKPLPVDGPLTLAFAPRSQDVKSSTSKAPGPVLAEAMHETCALVALGFLASQPLVERIEVAPRMRIHKHGTSEAENVNSDERAELENGRSRSGKSKEGSTRSVPTWQRSVDAKHADIEERIAEFIRASPSKASTAAAATGVSSREATTTTAPQAGRPRKLNYYAKSAVQAPGDTDSTPFTSLNITGRGQYVQVCTIARDVPVCVIKCSKSSVPPFFFQLKCVRVR